MTDMAEFDKCADILNGTSPIQPVALWSLLLSADGSSSDRLATARFSRKIRGQDGNVVRISHSWSV